MVGTTISHYRVLEKLGAGGMGVVYKAEDIRLGRFVALKFLPDDYADNLKLRERFQREARAISALNHPNICTIYDIGEEDGRVFIAMEFLDGVTLKDLVNNRPIGMDRIVDLASQVVDGLEAAHAHGIIHRDIKPANIFVTASGRAKILDFGLAKISTQRHAESLSGWEETVAGDSSEFLTSGASDLGTIPYMSPEQAMGKPLDSRTDIFSFGVTLYEMATGRMPFRGDTTGVLFLSIVEETPAPAMQINPDVPAELQRIIDKCLEKDRELRYQHAAEIRSDLKRLQQASGAHDIAAVGVAEQAAEAEPGSTARQSPSGNSSRTAQSETLATPAESPLAKGPARSAWKPLLAASVVLLAFALVGYLYLRSNKVSPSRPLGTIVLADFANTTGETTFDDSLRQALALDLGQSPFVNLISDRTVAATLKEMQKPATERLTRQVAREVCVRTNSAALVVGSIAPSGEGYSLTLKAVNCQTDAILAAVETEAQSRYSVLAALHKADGQLRSKLGESLASLQKFNAPLVEATTVSLEALQAYSQGLRERQAKGSLAGIPYLKRAIELDPNFAQAYASLGAMFVNTSQWALASDSYSRAYELRSRVSERERLYIEFNYFHYVLGESDKAIQVCKEWIRTYPTDSVPHARLGFNYLLSGQFETAAQEFREALRLGTDMPYSNLMAAYIRLGRLDEAKAMFDAARAHNLDSDFLRLNRYTLAFLERDSRAMQEQVDQAKERMGYEDTLLNAQSDVDAYFGRLDKARQLERQAVSATSTAKEAGRAANYNANAAWREAEIGHNLLSRKYATEALALSKAPDTQSTAALALARAGESNISERLADQLNAKYPHSTMVQYYALPTIHALNHIRNNQAAKAIEVLQPTLPYESGEQGFGNLQPAYVRGLAYLQLGKGPEAAAEFQKLIDHPGVVGIFVTGALARLQLARAEEISGKREVARQHYQDFFALWKDADPDVPILKQAKAEYAKLK